MVLSKETAMLLDFISDNILIIAQLKLNWIK